MTERSIGTSAYTSEHRKALANIQSLTGIVTRSSLCTPTAWPRRSTRQFA